MSQGPHMVVLRKFPLPVDWGEPQWEFCLPGCTLVEFFNSPGAVRQGVTMLRERDNEGRWNVVTSPSNRVMID